MHDYQYRQYPKDDPDELEHGELNAEAVKWVKRHVRDIMRDESLAGTPSNPDGDDRLIQAVFPEYEP